MQQGLCFSQVSKKRCAFCHLITDDLVPGVVVHWFRFPKKGPKREIWAASLLELDPSWAQEYSAKELNNTIHICSLHFPITEYDHRNMKTHFRAHLKEKAIPSLYGPRLYDKQKMRIFGRKLTPKDSCPCTTMLLEPFILIREGDENQEAEKQQQELADMDTGQAADKLASLVDGLFTNQQGSQSVEALPAVRRIFRKKRLFPPKATPAAKRRAIEDDPEATDPHPSLVITTLSIPPPASDVADTTAITETPIVESTERKTAKHRIFMKEDGQTCYMTQTSDDPITMSQLKTAQMVAMQTYRQTGMQLSKPPKMVLIRKLAGQGMLHNRDSNPLLQGTKVFNLLFKVEDPPEPPIEWPGGKKHESEEAEKELEPEVESQVEPEVESQGEPEVESQGEPEVESLGEPEIESQGEPEVESQAEPEVESPEEPEVYSLGEPEVESQGEPEIGPQGEPEIGPQGELEVKSQGKPEIEAQGEPDVEEQGEPETEMELEAGSAEEHEAGPAENPEVGSADEPDGFEPMETASDEPEEEEENPEPVSVTNIFESDDCEIEEADHDECVEDQNQKLRASDSTAMGETDMVVDPEPEHLREQSDDSNDSQDMYNKTLRNTLRSLVEHGKNVEEKAGNLSKEDLEKLNNLLASTPTSAYSAPIHPKNVIVLAKSPVCAKKRPIQEQPFPVVSKLVNVSLEVPPLVRNSSKAPTPLIQIVHPSSTPGKSQPPSIPSRVEPTRNFADTGEFGDLTSCIENYLNGGAKPALDLQKKIEVSPSDIGALMEIVWKRALSSSYSDVVPGATTAVFLTRGIVDTMKVAGVFGVSQNSPTLGQMQARVTQITKSPTTYTQEKNVYENKAKLLFKKFEVLKKEKADLKKLVTAEKKRATNLEKKNAQYVERINGLAIHPKKLLEQQLGDVLTPAAMHMMSRALFDDEKRMPYSPEVKSFCLNLHKIAPQAYMQVLKVFKECVPSLSTITKWRRETTDSVGEAIASVVTAEPPAPPEEELEQMVFEPEAALENGPTVEVQWVNQATEGEFAFGDQDMSILIDVMQGQEEYKINLQ